MIKMSNLSAEQIIDLLYYLGTDKVIYKPGNKWIQKKFKRNRYLKLKNKNYIIAYAGKTKFYISKEDEYLLQFRYFGVHSKDSPYLRCKIDEKRYFLHNLIMRPPKGYVVDHINGNKLDNRRANLRICKSSYNNKNKKQYCNSDTPNGVWYRKDRPNKPWGARIFVDNKRIGLGYYKTKEEAIQVRLEAEKKYYGEYRRREEDE